jgi:hypothetical protein
VIKHVGKTHGKFRELSVDGLKTMPIPYFGDIEKAEILTVGVNPAASEFKNRNWPEIEATADYLAPRLRNYFCLRYPVAHRWFSPWEESLRMLNGRSYRNGAAHLDLSPQATATIPRDVRPREMFLEMVESDLPIFFETISLCRAAKVLLMAGSVTNKFYINEFLQVYAPHFGYELHGEFQRRLGGRMACRHDLVSKTGISRLPVFFFSRGPKHPGDLIQLVRQKRKEICDCLGYL